MNRTCVYSKTRWLCVAMLLACAAGWVGAAEPNSVSASSVAEPNVLVIDPNIAQVDPTGTKITFIAFQKDSNIRDGLRLLAALCKKNIVPSAGVEGPLTISRLYDVTFEEALDAVLGFGFKYEQDGDFVRVYTAEQYKKIKEDPTRMVGKMIPVYYVNAEEVLKLIKPVLSTEGKTQTSTAAENSISGGEGDLGGGEGGGDDLAGHDMIIIYDYPEVVERVENLIREIDVQPKQVLIEATIMAARLTEQMEFGIDWNLLSGQAVTSNTIARGSGYGTPIQFGPAFSTNTIAGPGLTVGITAGNARAIITALENVTETTLLANPKVLAVNKQEGIVYIGRKIGYVSQTSQTQTSTTQTVEFLETGTRLAFRPYVGNDGYIRMDIYPKDSDGVLKQNNIPDETSTELKTNVMVKDGETVVIGGLFRDTVVTSRDQVPLLGNLPLVGVLFRGTKDTVTREEVIIILTPHIISEPAETKPEERADDIRQKREGAKDSLQVIGRTRLAEDAYARAAKYYLEGDIEKAVFNVKVALQMRPTYLEALRLRERIIAETDPEQFRQMDSVVVEKVDEEQTEMWNRR